MSLTLDNTKPHPVSASARTSNMLGPGGTTTLYLAGNEISMADFRGLVLYVMCNTDLAEDDPRIELLEELRSLTVINDQYGKRFDSLLPLPHHFAWR